MSIIFIYKHVTEIYYKVYAMSSTESHFLYPYQIRYISIVVPFLLSFIPEYAFVIRKVHSKLWRLYSKIHVKNNLRSRMTGSNQGSGKRRRGPNDVWRLLTCFESKQQKERRAARRVRQPGTKSGDFSCTAHDTRILCHGKKGVSFILILRSMSANKLIDLSRLLRFCDLMHMREDVLWIYWC